MSKSANTTEKKLEDLVENILKHNDYFFIDKNKYMASKKILEQKIYSKQLIIGKTIYNTNRKCDFITYNPFTEKEIIIECKWQDVAGSVDEKYPFLVLNIKKLDVDTIIVLDGKGYKEAAKERLKEQVGGCLIDVLDFAEFERKTRAKDLI